MHDNWNILFWKFSILYSQMSQLFMQTLQKVFKHFSWSYHVTLVRLVDIN